MAQIVEWDLADVGGLTDFYNSQAEDLPYCYPVSRDEFETNHARDEYWDKPVEGLSHQRIFVAEEAGRVVGCVHTGRLVDEEGSRWGCLRLFAYIPGHRQAGQALLETAESVLRDQGEANAGTMCGYVFHVGGHVAVQWAHVTSLLTSNGYEVTNRNIWMQCDELPTDKPTPPDPSAVVVVNKPEAIGKIPGIHVHAYHERQSKETKIVECLNNSLGGYQKADAAQHTIYTFWIGCEEPYRGRGWGRWALLRCPWEAR